MLVKVTFLFLLGMVLIAMVGRALFPGALGRSVRRPLPARRPATCPRCGTFIIGNGPCPCGAASRKA